MATSGRGSGVVGYNVQVAVETKHHLIVTHEVTNEGSDRSQLSPMAKQAKATLDVEKLDAAPAWSVLRSTKRLGRRPLSVAPALRRKNEYALLWWLRSASRSSSAAVCLPPARAR